MSAHLSDQAMVDVLDARKPSKAAPKLADTSYSRVKIIRGADVENKKF